MGNVKTSTVDESVPLNLRSVFSTEFNKLSQLLKARGRRNDITYKYVLMFRHACVYDCT